MQSRTFALWRNPANYRTVKVMARIDDLADIRSKRYAARLVCFLTAHESACNTGQIWADNSGPDT